MNHIHNYITALEASVKNGLRTRLLSRQLHGRALLAALTSTPLLDQAPTYESRHRFLRLPATSKSNDVDTCTEKGLPDRCSP